MQSLSYKQKRLLGQFAAYVAGAIIIIFCLSPIAWIFLTSIKPTGQVIEIPVRYIPFLDFPLSFENYWGMINRMQFLSYLRNSLIISSVTTVLVLVLASLSAYAISRLRFRFRTTSLLTILVVGMMPSIVMIAPIFFLIRELRLINSYLGIIIPHTIFALPVAVWLLASYFAQLPFDLEDAAKVDGYNPFQVYYKIVMPLSAPGLFSAGILAFIGSWGEFMFALTITHDIRSRTALVAIATLPGAFHLNWGWITAGVVLSLIPILIIVLVFQKWVIQGLTAGAVKY